MVIRGDVFTPYYFLFYNYNNLIILPLIVSRFAEKKSKKSEWDRIKEYGNKINDETRKKH